MSDNILEAASQKPQKGRPRLMGETYQKQSAQLWSTLTSTKALQDRHHAMHALNALGGVVDSRFVEYPRLFPGKDVFRWSLLAELGRLEDKETIRDFAQQFERSDLSVKSAISRLRALRTGKKPTADKVRLANVLIDAVNRYKEATDCDWPTALEAIDICKAACEEAAE